MRSLDLLIAPFRLLAQELIFTALPARGVVVRPYYTVRSPWEQARLWRQSRSRETIEAKIEELVSADAPTLATYLRSVGAQSGKPVTRAIPGLSWHQWREAFDVFVLKDGKAIWDAADPGYIALAEEAKKLGMTPGRYFPTFPDCDHIQARPQASPKGIYTLPEIDETMRSMYGIDEKLWLSKQEE